MREFSNFFVRLSRTGVFRKHGITILYYIILYTRGECRSLGKTDVIWYFRTIKIRKFQVCACYETPLRHPPLISKSHVLRQTPFRRCRKYIYIFFFFENWNSHASAGRWRSTRLSGGSTSLYMTVNLDVHIAQAFTTFYTQKAVSDLQGDLYI